MQRYNDIEEIIEYYAKVSYRKSKKVLFLQIGANDGVTGDPLHAVIRKYRWEGVAVEPVQAPFVELERNYAEVEGVKCLQLAVSTRCEVRDFYSVEGVTGVELPWWAGQIGSLRREIVARHIAELPEGNAHVRVEPMQCETQKRLMSQFPELCKIKVWQCDVEGYDAKLVREAAQLVKEGAWKPELIMYENRHLDWDEARLCGRMLSELEYCIIVGEVDTIAFHREALEMGGTNSECA